VVSNILLFQCSWFTYRLIKLNLAQQEKFAFILVGYLATCIVWLADHVRSIKWPPSLIYKLNYQQVNFYSSKLCFQKSSSCWSVNPWYFEFLFWHVWHSVIFHNHVTGIHVQGRQNVSRLFIYNKDNTIQGEKRQCKAHCWSNVTQQTCHVKEFWDKQSCYFTYTNQTSVKVYFNSLMCINSLQIFQKGKCHSSVTWKTFQKCSNYFSFHRHFKVRLHYIVKVDRYVLIEMHCLYLKTCCKYFAKTEQTILNLTLKCTVIKLHSQYFKVCCNERLWLQNYNWMWIYHPTWILNWYELIFIMCYHLNTMKSGALVQMLSS